MFPHPPHESGVVSRVPELLEQLCQEWESISRELHSLRMHRDGHERKFQAQLSELNTMQQTVYELERKHAKLRKDYEENVMAMRKNGDGQSGPLPEAPSSLTQRSTALPPSSLLFAEGGPHPPKKPRSMPPSGPMTAPQVPSSGPFFSTGAHPFHTPHTLGPPIPTLDSHPLPNTRALPHAFGPLPIPPVSYPNGSSDIPRDPMMPSQMMMGRPPLPSLNSARYQRSGMETDDNEQRKQSQVVANTAAQPPAMVEKEEDWTARYNPREKVNFRISLQNTLPHGAVVCCVQFSNDEKYLATGSNRCARVFDTTTGEEVAILREDSEQTTDSYIRSLRFSPDGKILATGAEDKTVQLWSISGKDSRLLRVLEGHAEAVYALDFSANGKLLSSGSGDGTVRVWNIETGECLQTFDSKVPTGGVTSLAISPDGKLAAAGSLNAAVRVYDLEKEELLKSLTSHSDSVYSVAFSHDGKWIASGGLDKRIVLWNFGSDDEPKFLEGHTDYVLSVTYSNDGEFLVSGSKDQSVQFWDTKTLTPLVVLEGHTNSVMTASLSSSGSLLATGSGDESARIWKIEKHQ